MPAMPLTGGFYEDSALQFDAQRCVNMYPEFSPVDNGKGSSKLKNVPGLVTLDEKFVTADYMQTIDLHTTSEGRAISVFCYRSGSTYYLSVGDLKFIPVAYITIAIPDGLTDDIKQIKVADNGSTLASVVTDFVTSYGYFYNIAGVLTQITDADYPSNVIGVTFKDTYFVWLTRGLTSFDPSKIYISSSYASDAANCINALDFTTVEINPDESRAIETIGDEIVVFGSKSIQYFYNSGNVDFPFETNKSVTQSIGVSSPFSIEKLKNTLFFIGQDDTGASIIYKMNGYQLERISTHAIEIKLNEITIEDEDSQFNINSYSYQSNGHYFYCIKISALNTTLCYDTATGLWHERVFNDIYTELYYPVTHSTYYNGKNITLDSDDNSLGRGKVVRVSYFDDDSKFIPKYSGEVSVYNFPIKSDIINIADK